MRILLTTDTIGGVWSFTREMCQGLLSLGHQVALVSLGSKPSQSQSAWCAEMRYSYGAGFRYQALELPLEWMDDNSRAYFGAETELLQIADDFAVDLVHSNQFCFGALPLPVPKVVTAHSDVLSWAEACEPNGIAKSLWLERYCALVESGLRGAHAVVAPTRWMANALAHGFAEAQPVQVIFNGRTLPHGTAAGERLLQAVSVGRLWDKAKQAGLIADMGSTMPVVLAGQTSLDGRALSEPELFTIFRRSSVYVAASLYEPFGLAPLEAALCGCAVVANDIPSLREVWQDAALYFNGRDSLKSLLDHLHANPAELGRARARSLARALQFTAEKMVERYLALYQELTFGLAEGVTDAQGAYAL